MPTYDFDGITYTYTTDYGDASVTAANDSISTANVLTSFLADNGSGGQRKYIVTSIGNGAFYNKINLKTVTFSDTSILQTIGDRAFLNCRSLGSITIPSSVQSIGISAFQQCYVLLSITIPARVQTLGDSAVGSCINLVTVTFSGTSRLITIRSNVFSDCASLESITIPSSVQSIGDNAFRGCGLLSSITIPANLTSIGNTVFQRCIGLRYVNWVSPSKSISLGVDAFTGNNSHPMTVKYYQTTGANALPRVLKLGGNHASIYPTGSTISYSRDALTYSVIYDGNFNTGGSVPSIPVSYNYGSTITVLENIGELVKTGYTFSGWNTVSDGSGTNYVVNTIFQIYANTTLFATWILTSYSVIYDGNFNTGGSVPSEPVSYNYGSTVIVLENTGQLVKRGYTFSGWNTVSDGSGTNYVANTTFQIYANTTLYVQWEPNVLVYDGISYAYMDNPNVASVTAYDNITPNITILSAIVVDDNTYNVRSIGNDVFASKSSLTTVTVPASVTSLGQNAFRECRGLTTVTFVGTSQLQTIGQSAFQGCISLETITIPATVTSIENYAFLSCRGLTTVIFVGISQLRTIGVAAFDSCLTLGSFTIPATVTTIGDYAFYTCTNLESITIPASVTSIGLDAFLSCTSLRTIDWVEPDTNITLGTNAFNTETTTTTPSSGSVTYCQTASQYNLPSALNPPGGPESIYFGKYTISYKTGPFCFNKGTEILCLNKEGEEEYILIEHLKKGDFVKSFNHGYRKIDTILNKNMINIPSSRFGCMFKMEKTDANGLTKDLIISGGHSILVDDLGELKEANDKIFGGNSLKIDDKYLLLSSVSKDFVKLENRDTYTWYQFVLENDGDDERRFGVWANGILTETPSKNQIIKMNLEV